MQKKQIKSDFLCKLFQRLSVKIGKPIEELKPFYKTLKDNWYDNQKALREISDDEFIQLKIPVKLAKIIKEEIASKKQEKSFFNDLPIAKDIFQFFERCCNIHQEVVGQSMTSIEWNDHELTLYKNQLQKDLREKQKYNSTQVSQIFETLHKIIHKIVQDPFEIKFRTLKKSNLKVQKIVTKNPSVVKFLTLLGFKEDPEKYFMTVPKIEQLTFIQEALAIYIKKNKKENVPQVQKVQQIQQFSWQVPAIPKRIPNPQQKTTMQSIEEQFSKQKLAQMQYVDSLNKLLELRKKMMSQTLKDRQLKIYHKDHETNQVEDPPEVSLEEEFDKSDDKILGSYWKKIMKENEKNSQLQTKRKREFDLLVRQKIYSQTIIRIRLPNDFVIEAKFGSLQKLSDVYKLVSSIVIGDIFLYLTPPVKRLDKEMEKTLIDLESVPTGIFFLGIKGEGQIVDQYRKNFQK